ncbi:flagellin (plasmid) [Paroceanicella profunda]|uniref:Flagellin n=1 Tax=Paroceanicella profunda TaxID=2579971 RepID=A0A5B8G5V7_9RHOB|nr:flagellin [Paroceanicella profunda]QDL94772.1 flagellin [Paroceanicella profunda]
MSSILTNTSAMVALQTLNSTNKNLAMTTNEISTGKSVATARDNASIWAIAQTMQTDVDGFSGISDGLNTGSAAVAVARTAAETVTGLLGQVKEKIIAAQDPASDRAKLQTDIDQLVQQVGSVVDAAQFNGLNLVDGTNGSINVLASLNRDSSGNVTVANIQVSGQDLGSAAGTAPTGFFAVGNGTTSANGTSFGGIIDSGSGTNTLVLDSANFTAALGGEKISITIAGQTATYTVTANDMDTTNGSDPNTVIMSKVADKINSLGITGLVATMGTGAITLTNTGTIDFAFSGEITAPGAGGLSGLAGIDVNADAAGALAAIEPLIQTAIDASAAFGSAQARIDIQNEFVGKLTDSLKTGIGALVDADMEEASARLQALQVQQQLGIQSLSIANQAPQNVLSLFR